MFLSAACVVDPRVPEFITCHGYKSPSLFVVLPEHDVVMSDHAAGVGKRSVRPSSVATVR